MTQRVKRAERKRRQRAHQDAVVRYVAEQMREIAKRPPLEADDYVFSQGRQWGMTGPRRRTTDAQPKP